MYWPHSKALKIYHLFIYLFIYLFICFLWRFERFLVMTSPYGASRSHLLDTPHSVGLLWTSDQPDAEISTWQHITLTTDRYSYPRRDSTLQSQQASGRRSTLDTAWSLGLAINCWIPKTVFTVFSNLDSCRVKNRGDKFQMMTLEKS